MSREAPKTLVAEAVAFANDYRQAANSAKALSFVRALAAELAAARTREKELRAALERVRHDCLLQIRRAAFSVPIGARYSEKLRLDIAAELARLEMFIDDVLKAERGDAPPEHGYCDCGECIGLPPVPGRANVDTGDPADHRPDPGPRAADQPARAGRPEDRVVDPPDLHDL